jgi:sphingomyelin phosphodiesterase acid-like 3
MQRRRENGIHSKLRTIVFAAAVSVFCAVGAGDLAAQQAKASPPEKAAELTVLMMSDLHFDPYHDPGKVEQLMKAPESEWTAILAAPPSANHVEDLARLQKACKARGVDTPSTLLKSGLEAMKATAPNAAFALVTGDLVAHDFDCRMKAVRPQTTEAEYEAFAEKTFRYVVGQVRLTLTGTPVYVALGNNDTGCKDYFMDPSHAFLKATEEIMVGQLSGSPKEVRAAHVSYSSAGDMSFTLPAPMRKTRLLVLNDNFQSRKHMTCGGKAEQVGVEAGISWLNRELYAARQNKEQVWVMGHIPAGIDPYSTFSKLTDVCGGAKPVMFLSSERLAQVMGEYADVIRVGIFGHSHMDEMRLFGQEGEGAKDGKVAIKMINSLTPWDGNGPAFTVAKVDPTTARLVDYEVMTSSNFSGVDATWKKEYDYAETYHQADFSPDSLKKLIGDFAADRDAHSEMSHAYLANYFVGADQSTLLKPLWPDYVCAMTNHSIKSFAACVCPAGVK